MNVEQVNMYSNRKFDTHTNFSQDRPVHYY